MDIAAQLNSPAFYANPYKFYAEMRERDPILYSPLRGGAWLVTSYADVVEGIREPRLSNARSDSFMASLPQAARGEFAALSELMARWLIFYDPPEHTRVRKLLGRGMSQSSVEALRSRIERVVQELLAPALARGGMDLMEDFAFQIPLQVIVELLGVPTEMRPEFMGWSRDIAQLFTVTPGVEQIRRAQQSVGNLVDYLRQRVTARRHCPSDDILSVLIQAEEDGRSLTEKELYAQCVMLLFAGHETTRNLIGNGIHALLSNPQQLALLRQDPALLKPALEEMLRYDSPAQMLGRVVTQDFAWRGRSLRKGQYAMLFAGAANRDPAQFPDPDAFLILRKDNRHLALGGGHHLCIGAGLARLEGMLAIQALLRAAPGLRRVGPAPEYQANLVLRGLKNMHVEF